MFSQFTEVLTVAMATSELRACGGRILLRGIILHWHRCSLRVLVWFCLLVYFFILVSCSCNIDLSPSRLLLSAWLCIRKGSGSLQKKGGFSWRAAGTLLHNAAVTRILHVSCLTLQSVNWDLVQQPTPQSFAILCSSQYPIYQWEVFYCLIEGIG